MTHRTTSTTPGAITVPGAAGPPTQGVLIEMPPTVRPRLLGTRNGVEIVVTCPRCNRLHRHRGPGQRRAPCGLVYIVRTRPAGAR